MPKPYGPKHAVRTNPKTRGRSLLLEGFLKINAKALIIPERTAGITAPTTGEEDAPIINPVIRPPKAIPANRTIGIAGIVLERRKKGKDSIPTELSNDIGCQSGQVVDLLEFLKSGPGK